MPWVFYVGLIWLITAAFAFLPIVPYATFTARHMLVIYTLIFVIAALTTLFGTRRAK